MAGSGRVGRQRRKWTAAAIAVGIALALAPANALAGRPATKITISAKVPAFHGSVSSSDSSWVGGRTVELFRKTGAGRKRLGRDTTSDDGSWAVEIGNLKPGAYVAKVRGSRSCRGARSESVVVD